MSLFTFDKSKPHGTIWGGAFHGRLFQNGQVFDHEGTHLGDASEAPADDPAQGALAAVLPTDDAAQVAASQAAVATHGNYLLAAVKLVEQATAKVVAELADVPDHLLDFVHQVESAGKQRADVLAAVLQEKGSRAMQAEKDAQANGLTASQAGLTPPVADQLSAQLNA